ncbi:MAG: hemolysin family protein [Sandaracinaceae bacterium]
MTESLDAPGLELIALVLAILGGSAFAALHEALAAFGEVRLLAAEEEGGRRGRVAARILAAQGRMPVRYQTGQAVCLVLAVGLAMHLAGGAPPWVVALTVAGVGFAFAALSVGSGALARARATTWTMPMVFWLQPLELLTIPFAAPLSAFARFLSRTFPPPRALAEAETAVREVEQLIERREESGSIPEDFAELLLSVLEFKDTVAREVMVPRTQMKAVGIDTPMDDVLQVIVREGHSRYPVYRDRVDQVEGILYAKDLFRILKDPEAPRDVALERIIRRPPFFVAETHPIGKLLREMQARRVHLAVVVDEFGGTSGIVTLEDIVEEIVGEIQDEHDRDQAPIQEISPGRWWVDATVSIYDLVEVIDADLNEERAYDSLGGMLVDLAGRVPEVGHTIQVDSYDFIVREADERHVTRVEVLRRPEAPVEAAE